MSNIASTLLDICQEVANQLGKNNGDVADTKRDTAIKRARRRFYKEYPWSFTKKSDTITFASGVAGFPSDYDTNFEPKIYSYSGVLKKEYKLVPLEDVSGYTTDIPVFAIDYGNSQFVTNLDSAPNITYHIRVSSDMSNTSVIEPCDDISAIVSLSVALYWLLSERNDDMFKMFKADYDTEIDRLIKEDAKKSPVRRFRDDNNGYGFGDLDE